VITKGDESVAVDLEEHELKPKKTTYKNRQISAANLENKQ
jgi:hypothetical protein